jgi:hypothetical protein
MHIINAKSRSPRRLMKLVKPMGNFSTSNSMIQIPFVNARLSMDFLKIFFNAFACKAVDAIHHESAQSLSRFFTKNVPPGMRFALGLLVTKNFAPYSCEAYSVQFPRKGNRSATPRTRPRRALVYLEKPAKKRHLSWSLSSLAVHPRRNLWPCPFRAPRRPISLILPTWGMLSTSLDPPLPWLVLRQRILD